MSSYRSAQLIRKALPRAASISSSFSGIAVARQGNVAVTPRLGLGQISATNSSFRALQTSATRVVDQKARQPENDGARAVESGKPVADSAVKNEERISGLPKSEEAIDGEWSLRADVAGLV
jgi:hypothetical protein